MPVVVERVGQSGPGAPGKTPPRSVRLGPPPPGGGPFCFPRDEEVAVTPGSRSTTSAAHLERVLEHPLLRRIGRTPLTELRRLPPHGLTVYAKLEGQNPGGSVKDRAARAIVLDAFRQGLLPHRRLLDSTRDRKSTRLNSSHSRASRMPSSA